MNIAIIGLGYIGLSLAKRISKAHTIYGTTRNIERLAEYKSIFKIEELDVTSRPSSELLNCDIIILNIPPFAKQLDWFKTWDWNFNKRIIFLSSISVYELNKGIVDEKIEPEFESTKVHSLIEQENWVKDNFTSHCIVRLGGLLGGPRHPGKVLAGRANIKRGDAPINLVHQMDVVGFLGKLIHMPDSLKLYNLVYPYHPSRKVFYRTYALESGLILPSFEDGGEEDKIVTDSEVEKIYRFQYSIN